ncbi:TRAP transporter substrate-binding protein [Arhodomonas sp. SL1]|uniref:TRAP transporter substrate-binding protein n=1 Tax=Arhodomonas sp. SL1 TaxID=3425691 RepID=UPI003F8822E8
MKRIITAAVMAAATVVATGAQAKEFKIGLITPPSHAWTETARELGQSLEQRSDGEHSLAVFPSGQLGDEAQMLQQLRTGAVDMAFMTMAEISNRVPNMGAFFTPYLVEDIDAAARLLKSDVAYDLLDELPGQMGVIGLGYGMAGLRQLEGRAPIESVDDLRGNKVRITPFEPTRHFHDLLGVAPTPMPLPAVYDALANGQVDAIEMDVENMVKQKYYTVAPHIVLSRHMMFPMVAVVSPRTWAGLSEGDQAMLRELTEQHLASLLEHMVVKEKEWTEELKGLEEATVTEVGPEFFGEAIEQWKADWREKAPAMERLEAVAAEY